MGLQDHNIPQFKPASQVKDSRTTSALRDDANRLGRLEEELSKLKEIVTRHEQVING